MALSDLPITGPEAAGAEQRDPAAAPEPAAVPEATAAPDPAGSGGRDGLHVARFSSAGMAEDEARQAYRDRLDGILDTAFLQPFEAELDAYRMGSLSVLVLAASARSSIRTPARLALDRYDAIGVQFAVSGRATGDADGRSLVSEPGAVMLLDYARPFSVTDLEPRTVINVAVPRAVLPVQLRDAADWHGAIPAGPAAQLLAGFMAGLAELLPTLPAASGPGLETAFTALLLAALGEGRGAMPTGDQARLIRRAGQLIDDRIGSPDLGPLWLAGKLNVSRSELYNALERFGGVSRFILKRRLARARAALEDPTDARRIGAIAFTFGFASEAHFARAFRAAFGTTASAVRRVAGTES